MPKDDIPFGSEFSPSVVDLPELLRMVQENAPDRKSLQSAIDQRFFPHQNVFDTTKTLGDNTFLSLVSYGLLCKGGAINHYELTDFGQELIQVLDKPTDLYNTFGKHVLANCKGLEVIECIRDLVINGTSLKKLTIANELRRRGYHVSRNGKHLNVLRQWLEICGLVNEKKDRSTLWVPNERRVQELLGFSFDELDNLAELSPEQRDFARALALLDEDNIPSNRVQEYATTLYGTVFPEGGLPQSVLHKLQEVGLIEWEKTTDGRGAKPHLVSPTDKLRTQFLFPVLEATRESLGNNYKQLVRMRMNEILRDLDSGNSHVKGIALEALAFYLTRILDLHFVSWRLRSNQTGGSEVDVLAEGTRLIFSRWQIQCKNTKRAHLDQVAKEVGIAAAMRTNVVMFVCTGSIGAETRRFARSVMENTAMQIILLDNKDLDEIKQCQANIARILNEQATLAMKIKRSQIQTS